MNLEFPSMADYGLGAPQKCWRERLKIILSIPFTVAVLLNAARTDSVDLTLSRVFLRDGEAVGGALIARRGWTAGWPAWRSCRRPAAPVWVAWPCGTCSMKRKPAGIARWRWRSSNKTSAAVELYRACGFREIRRLIGFAGPPPPGAALPPNLIQVDCGKLPPP